jgi:cyanate permease
MKAKLLSLLLLASLAIPAPASQQAGVAARLSAMQQQMGFTLDPHRAQALSITLPTRFDARGG